MHTKVVKALLAKDIKIATAESCTGGLVAQLITSVPGSSQCFDMGLVVYSNESKQELLGISKTTLEKYGAVSHITALEMSSCIKKMAKADIGVGVTGIAGPSGATEEKPVGLVYISVCGKGVHTYRKLELEGEREQIREQTAKAVFKLVEECLKKRK
jgi:nicotinamide-nucleotide amidase